MTQAADAASGPIGLAAWGGGCWGVGGLGGGGEGAWGGRVGLNENRPPGLLIVNHSDEEFLLTEF